MMNDSSKKGMEIWGKDGNSLKNTLGNVIHAVCVCINIIFNIIHRIKS